MWVQYNYSFTILLIHTAPDKLKNSRDNFNILSLNVQSLNAKYDALVVLLDIIAQQNMKFHAICIQETWLNDNTDMDLFQLEGYNCISQSFNPLCSSHGGLVTYVDSEYSASGIESVNDSTVWGGLFILVHDPSLVKDIVVGNIYRPPKDDNNRSNVDTFARELEPIFARINDTRAEIFLAGDYNINFL